MILYVADVTVPISIFSLVLTGVSLWICVLTLNGDASRAAEMTRAPERGASYGYYRNAARFASICNVGCSLSVSLYCIWIIFEPEQELAWFIALRALPTFFWFIAKAGLVWLYNGVLFFAFKGSSFATSATAFRTVNVLISLAVPIHLVLGYVGVFYGMPWMITLGFEGYRIEYILMTWYLLFRSVRIMLKVDAHDKQLTVPDAPADKPSLLISVATKNSVLVLFVSVSACFVAMCWTLFDFALGQNYLTLLLPMLMFSADGVIDSCCIYLFFSFGETAYYHRCKWVDGCCRRILTKPVHESASKPDINEVPDWDVEISIHVAARRIGHTETLPTTSAIVSDPTKMNDI